MSGRVQAWRDGALGICSRQNSTKHTAHSLQRPFRHLIKHRLQLSGFVLQGEREGICLPPASLPSHDCSHVICFNVAISSQLCRHLQLGYSDSWQLFRGPQGQLLSLGSDHTLQNTSGRSLPEMENTYGCPFTSLWGSWSRGQHRERPTSTGRDTARSGGQPLHTRVSPKDMSPGRSFFVDTFGIRAGLGYK